MSSMKPVKPAQAHPLHQNLWMRRVSGASELLATVAIDETDQRKKPIEHRIEIQQTHYTSTGARYRLTYLGATLIESARDPEYEACRALLARGITGTLVTQPRRLGASHEGRHRTGREADDRREGQRRPQVCSLQAIPKLTPRRRCRIAFPV
jgi:hypothetical protein